MRLAHLSRSVRFDNHSPSRCVFMETPGLSGRSWAEMRWETGSAQPGRPLSSSHVPQCRLGPPSFRAHFCSSPGGLVHTQRSAAGPGICLSSRLPGDATSPRPHWSPGTPPLALPTDGELAQRDQAACPGPHRRRAQAWPPAGLSSLHAQPTVPAPGAFAAPLTEPPPSCPVPQVQSFLRGWLCRRKWKTIIQDYIRSPHADSMRKRNQVVFSMLEAEAEYVQQLHILVNNFLRPLRMAASSKKPPITHDDVSSIFLNR